MVDLGYIDVETYSRYDLKEVGADVYSRNCEIILASYAYNDEPVQLWECGQNEAEVKELLAMADLRIAHNVWFEYHVLKRARWCNRPIEDWHCTMAQAYAHCLPAKLELLGRAMGLPEDKLKVQGGNKLIRLFSKPQRNGNRLRKDNLPEEWDMFCKYGIGDCVTLREVFKRMPRVNLNVGRAV